MTGSTDLPTLVAGMPGGPRSREAIARTYDGALMAELRHAFRRARLARVAPVAAIGGAVAVETYDAAISLAAGSVSAVAALWTVWALARGARAARSRQATGARHAALERVRRHRPHAIDADPVLAHVEYALDVERGGDVVIWQFLPVPSGLTEQELPARWRLLPGRPNHIATEHHRASLAGRSTAEAAEAVFDWQERTAGEERRAVDGARRDHDLDRARSDAELDAPELLRRLIPGR